jgi:hypothetical protein
LKIAIYNGFTHEKWGFSIVMLAYQRVPIIWGWLKNDPFFKTMGIGFSLPMFCSYGGIKTSFNQL